MPPHGVANGPMDLKFGTYIAYISVSKSTPMAVTGPHGQLASFIFCQLGSASYRRLVLKEVPLPLLFTAIGQCITGLWYAHYSTSVTRVSRVTHVSV